MLAVHVWGPTVTANGPLVGHASVTMGLDYISWWPEEGAFNVGPHRKRSLMMDIAAEADRQPTNGIIHGLDEEKIRSWWAVFGLQSGGQELQGPLPPYHLLAQNCSTVAAVALRVGGGDKYSDSWWVRNNVVWTPMDVLRYAQAIRSGIGK